MEEDQKFSKQIEEIKSKLKTYQDFHKKGIIFWDIFPLFASPSNIETIIDMMLESIDDKNIDCVVGIESKGFLFAPLLAIKLKVKFIPIRKKGKLPGKVSQIDYENEYTKSAIEINDSYLENIKKLVVVDDLLATGGTLKAANELLISKGVQVVNNIVLIEITKLKGRDVLKNVKSIIQV